MSDKVKRYIEVDRGGIIETRGTEGNEDEVREFVEHLNRVHGVRRVLTDTGRDVTAEYLKEGER